jgi:hypothetical protein
MAWDESGEGRESTAGEYASALKDRLRVVLVAAGHGECEYLAQASYDPASGQVVCGCGVFEPLPEDDPQNPPWATGEPDGFDGPIGDGQQGPTGPPPNRRGGNTTPQAADPISSTLALIDPTEVYGPEDVERHILDTLYRLETGALFERETVVATWKAEQAFNVKYNAYIAEVATGGAADVRKAQAMNHCAAEHAAMLEAKMMKEAVKQTMHNLRAVLSGYQSTSRSIQSSYNAGGGHGAPPVR